MRRLLYLLAAGCGATAGATSDGLGRKSAAVVPAAREARLAELTQLTFGGENAEAYFSSDGTQLVYQASPSSESCDQIFRIDVAGGAPRRVSTGLGRTTCAFFFPGARHLLYSSTHEASPACPPKPDRSRGYVWPLHEGYEIYRARADGSGLEAITRSPGYDAEATVCGKDGSVIFTSTRDGDLELYRMDADGKNVRRLTRAPGYDGGAFFSPDCRRIVWRASRPAPGPELDDHRALLKDGLVRPGKLELWVANADGSEAQQVTYLGAASFAPSWFPTGDRIIFSSNHGDPKGREFELYAVNVDGSGLERVTDSPGFDGFPMFSPDGTRLVFASNRNGKAPGETNVFVARWNAGPPIATAARAEDRVMADVVWLASDERQGRGIATPGLDAAAAWIEERFAEIGLEPAGDAGYRHEFEVPVGIKVAAGSLELDGARHEVRPAPFSSSVDALTAPVVYVGYGITAPDLGHDDYAGRDVKGKIVLVRRFSPDTPRFEGPVGRRLSDPRWKAWNAREHGARAVIVADLDEDEAERSPRVGGLELAGDAGLPVVFASREVARLLVHGKERATLSARLEVERRKTWNVVGRLRGRAAGTVVVGAHYDHLGLGGASSLAPGVQAPHNGADDNASGVAAVLEAARILAARRGELARDVIFVAFSAEELGVVGSSAFTRRPPPGVAMGEVAAMVNLDMVGRLRDNQLQVLGGETAGEWPSLVAEACGKVGLGCAVSSGGYGPSDQTPFYAAGLPVLHLFTGAHRDYHRPTDDAHLVNAAGAARVAAAAAEMALLASAREARLTYRAAPAPASASPGDLRHAGASLGTVPDYAGPPAGQAGMLLAGVRAGGPAEVAGMRRGDILVELGGKDVRGVEDLMYVLAASKPGTRATAIVLREGKKVKLEVTFGPPMRR
jgi:Tol biopolymer transport system component/Zn-dependent M28 family amino/carboxypeptidase